MARNRKSRPYTQELGAAPHPWTASDSRVRTCGHQQAAGITPEQIEEQLAARLERQSILTGEDPTILFAIIDEGVLHRPIGRPEVMRDQLAHLQEMATRNNITVQVVPEDAAASCGIAGAFVLASLSDGSDTAYLESDCEGRVTAHPSDVIAISNKFAAISADALPKRPSLQLIAKVLKERWTRS